MPLYDYQCEACGQYFERAVPVCECDTPQYCPYPDCKSMLPAKKIISIGHGGFFRPDARWLQGISQHFERKIETVEDLRRYYADNPNIKPLDSHPCLPSHLGDIQRFPSEKDVKAARKKKALEKLVDMRKIEIHNSRISQSAPA